MKIQPIIFFFLLTIISHNCIAQDPQFSQFYGTSSGQVNPSFAGNMKEIRGMATFRSQWNGLTDIKTTMISIDGEPHYESENAKVGLGLYYLNNQYSNWYQYNQLAGQFAYRMYQNDFKISMGIQLGLISQSWGDLRNQTFADQYVTLNNGLASATSTDVLAKSIKANQLNADFSSGVLVDWDRGVNHTTYWLGVSANHLGYPYSENNKALSWQRMKLNLHAGVKIPVTWIPLRNTKNQLTREESFSVVANLQNQFGNSQLSLFTQWTYSPLVLGLGVRGIALSRTANQLKNDAVIAMFGVRQGRCLLQYSYDFTIAGLAGYTGGSHEFTLFYGFSGDLFKFKSKRQKDLPCP